MASRRRLTGALVFLVSLIAAAGFVLIALLVLDREGDGDAGESVVALVPPAGDDPAAGSGSEGPSAGTDDAAADPSTTTAVEAAAFGEEFASPDESVVLESVEVAPIWSGPVDFPAGRGWEPGTDDPRLTMWLIDDPELGALVFGSSHGLSPAGAAPPGWFGCRDLAPAPLPMPMPLTDLEAYEGQYLCAEMGETRVAQFLLESADGRISGSLIMWNLPPGG